MANLPHCLLVAIAESLSRLSRLASAAAADRALSPERIRRIVNHLPHVVAGADADVASSVGHPKLLMASERRCEMRRIKKARTRARERLRSWRAEPLPSNDVAIGRAWANEELAIRDYLFSLNRRWLLLKACGRGRRPDQRTVWDQMMAWRLAFLWRCVGMTPAASPNRGFERVASTLRVWRRAGDVPDIDPLSVAGISRSVLMPAMQQARGMWRMYEDYECCALLRLFDPARGPFLGVLLKGGDCSHVFPVEESEGGQ